MFRAPDSEGKNPANRFILGADHVGRDVLSRIIHGARISLVVTSVALFSGLILGVTIGVISGYYGGVVDEVLMRMVDVWYAIPFLLLAMVAVIIFEASLNLIIVLLILLAWSGYVRNLARRGFEPEGTRFRSFSSCCRGIDLQDHIQAFVARTYQHHLRYRESEGGATDLGGSLAQLFGSRNSGPNTCMGCSDCRRQGIRRIGLVANSIPWNGYFPCGSRL